MICVDCGADVPQVIGGSCPTCFTQRTPLLQTPEVVVLELCANCGARRAGAHWHDVAPDAPEDWVREQAVMDALGIHARVEAPIVDVEQRQLDERTFACKVAVHGHVDDADVDVEASLQLRRIRGVCDRCSRIAGGYYAAIIQLRATDRDVTPAELARSHELTAAELNRQINGGNRFAFLAKGGAMHGGWDYYIGDIDAGRNVARILKDRLGAVVSETAKLVGRREGEDVHRVTFLVRIRLFSPGDFAVQDGRPYLVTAVHPKSMQIVDLESHRKSKVHEDDVTRLGGPELIEEAVLVSMDASGAEVMDPVTYRTVPLLINDVPPGAQSVPVVRHEERLYWAGRAQQPLSS